MRLFLDTNVLFDYLLDSRGEFHEPAVQLMRLVATEVVEAGFSTSQATDIYYSLRKAVGDEVARSALRGLYALCELYEAPAQAAVEALESEMLDYEDAVQSLTARHYHCDYIVTRDLKDYELSSVPALDAFGILDLLDEKTDSDAD